MLVHVLVDQDRRDHSVRTYYCLFLFLYILLIPCAILPKAWWFSFKTYFLSVIYCFLSSFRDDCLTDEIQTSENRIHEKI